MVVAISNRKNSGSTLTTVAGSIWPSLLSHTVSHAILPLALCDRYWYAQVRFTATDQSETAQLKKKEFVTCEYIWYDFDMIRYEMTWYDMTCQKNLKNERNKHKSKTPCNFRKRICPVWKCSWFHGKTSPPCKQRQLWTLITRVLPYQRSFQLFGRRQLRFHCATDHLSVARECFTVFDDHTSRLSRVRNELKDMEPKIQNFSGHFVFGSIQKGDLN